MPNATDGRPGRRVDGAVFLAVLVAAGALLTGSLSPAGLMGLGLVLGGVLSALLMGFPLGTLWSALACAVSRRTSRQQSRQSALVWEAAARSAWTLSALAALAGFVGVLCSGFSGIAGFLGGMGERAAGVAGGAVLTVLCAVASLRLRRLADVSEPGTESAVPPPGSTRPERWSAGFGLVGLLALVAWSLFQPSGNPDFRAVDWLLHWPAWLLVIGGGLALALYLGEPGSGESLTLGLAAAGTVGVLLGVTQGLHGFATARIADVAGGLTLAVSSSYAALAGLVVIALPLTDRAAGRGEPRPSAAARWSAWGFPLLAVLLVLVVVLLVMVPIERKLP